MIHKTRGIVFRFTRFRETSIIVNIFTELFGLQSYIVNSVRSSKASGGKMALYQPLTLLDLVVYHREHAHIHRIKEVKCLHPYHTLATDVKKSTLGMFINEILNKTVKEESHSQEIFDFLLDALLALDAQEKGYENFHLIFLLKLSRLLGFGAHSIYDVTRRGLLNEAEENILHTLLTAEYAATLSINNTQRRLLLETLVRFYGEHIETLGEIKSVHVLHEVFL